MTDDDEEMSRISVDVKKTHHEMAKRKLEYGGITREIREAIRRVAVGEDMNQRSRLERQLEELQEKRDDLRAKRREIEASIETIETKINGVQHDISQLSSKEERYEAKLEELEYDLREGGQRFYPEHKKIERIAGETQREPEALINDLKERNPDIPDYAFEEGDRYGKNERWTGVPEEDIEIDVENREPKYR